MPNDLNHPFGPWARTAARRPSLVERLQKMGAREALIWLPLALMPVAIGGPPVLTYTTTDWGWSLSIRHHAASGSCASARLMGLAPAAEGQPGYWPHLDRNDDGWSCEGSSRAKRR